MSTLPPNSPEIPFQFDGSKHKAFAEGLGHIIMQYNGVMHLIDLLIHKYDKEFCGKDKSKISRLREILIPPLISQIEAEALLDDINTIYDQKNMLISHCAFHYDKDGSFYAYPHQKPKPKQIKVGLQELKHLARLTISITEELDKLISRSARF